MAVGDMGKEDMQKEGFDAAAYVLRRTHLKRGILTDNRKDA